MTESDGGQSGSGNSAGSSQGGWSAKKVALWGGAFGIAAALIGATATIWSAGSGEGSPPAASPSITASAPGGPKPTGDAEGKDASPSSSPTPAHQDGQLPWALNDTSGGCTAEAGSIDVDLLGDRPEDGEEKADLWYDDDCGYSGASFSAGEDSAAALVEPGEQTRSSCRNAALAGGALPADLESGDENALVRQGVEEGAGFCIVTDHERVAWLRIDKIILGEDYTPPQFKGQMIIWTQ